MADGTSAVVAASPSAPAIVGPCSSRRSGPGAAIPGFGRRRRGQRRRNVGRSEALSDASTVARPSPSPAVPRSGSGAPSSFPAGAFSFAAVMAAGGCPGLRRRRRRRRWRGVSGRADADVALSPAEGSCGGAALPVSAEPLCPASPSGVGWCSPPGSCGVDSVGSRTDSLAYLHAIEAMRPTLAPARTQGKRGRSARAAAG